MSRIRFEDLTQAELDELQQIVGGIDPGSGGFWETRLFVRGVAYLAEKRDHPELTWEATSTWTHRQVMDRVDVEEENPTQPPDGGNGSGSPTPSASALPSSAV